MKDFVNYRETYCFLLFTIFFLEIWNLCQFMFEAGGGSGMAKRTLKNTATFLKIFFLSH